MRYSRPQASFTYRQHDYASVVGPVRSPLALGSSLDATGSGTGSASGVTGSSGGTRTARDHPLLRPDRPPGVCLTELVRDAAARLPNGEGTRQEIMQLVSESVFLVDQPNPAQP
ncbi:unnamed protein product [Protopolystoma xenopodis]|uniref:Nuclear factor related to kappa-B-binding protein second winged helix domain-containing protein n=1 Tax=Protopolystoma xenopodis TaxID=117903 RepID=A0A448X4G8_9PLAT|nr:unnamed protein product [Protopolystoma xenopodis]